MGAELSVNEPKVLVKCPRLAGVGLVAPFVAT